MTGTTITFGLLLNPFFMEGRHSHFYQKKREANLKRNILRFFFLDNLKITLLKIHRITNSNPFDFRHYY